ncbi:HEPN domain-containing protein [Paenirhodobacter enshiensis]|uniref:HEPN domain-containing protein n=1 Tax=Paenirhodobacter enshiensis TaxID=1105367 RepID=UPI0012694A90|nr:HEPN domain-containing protein [Paenirhodobacter enshiensis]
MPVSFAFVDEIIKVREDLHGGKPGAPQKMADGSYEGRALNRACVVMLTSAMQAYVGEVFLECSEKAFGRVLSDTDLKDYRQTWSRWGNPSDANIIGLFRRLGIQDVFDGLSWQGQSTETLKTTLNTMNQVRNKIAHGQDIQVNGKHFSLTLSQVRRWRQICKTFSKKFGDHALDKIKR